MDRETRRAIEDLEFQRVVDALLALCRTPLGSARAQAMEPLGERAQIVDELRLVTEARRVLDGSPPPPFSGVADVAPACERLEKDSVPEPAEFIAIGRTLRAAALLRGYYMQQSAIAPGCGEIAQELVDLADLADRVLRTFDERGEVADHASDELYRLRRREIALREALRVKMESLASSPELQDVLQDNYFTVRDDRYVLPIKASFKPKFDGILHGSSQTGQTVYIEPAEMIQSNNELKLAQYQIAQEEHRILRELGARVVKHVEPIRQNLAIVARLDHINARALLSQRLDAVAPQISERSLELRRARNPLLVLQGVRVVPNGIEMRPPAFGMVISGPNAGGKTVTLSTVGLCALMVRFGMHIPAAADSELPLFERFLTVMGDLQDIEQSLSTFTGHVRRLTEVLRRANATSLVLIDEIAIGTEPQQGAALATAVLERLADASTMMLVTTHYNRLKTLALLDPRFMNASVSSDPTTLRPTYRLELGGVGQSHPFEIAEDAGLERTIIARARELMGDVDESLQRALAGLDELRNDLTRQLDEQREARRELEQEKKRLAAERAEIRAKAAALIEREAAEVTRQLEGLRETIRTRTAELQRASDIREVQSQRKRVRELEEKLEKAAPASETPLSRKRMVPEALAVGVEVYVRSFGGVGTLLSTPDAKGRVSVQVGSLKLTVQDDDLFAPEAKADGAAASSEPARAQAKRERREAPAASSELSPVPLQNAQNSLDLRGFSVDEALQRIDKYLDEQLLDGRPVVYLIHGHGTGALKRAVRDYLRKNELIRTARPGEPGQGGDGVTIVWLNN